MAGLVPAIHAGPLHDGFRMSAPVLHSIFGRRGVDARDKPGHDVPEPAPQLG